MVAEVKDTGGRSIAAGIDDFLASLYGLMRQKRRGEGESLQATGGRRDKIHYREQPEVQALTYSSRKAQNVWLICKTN